LTYFLLGVLASISAVIAGRVSWRVGLKTMLIVSALGTGLLYLPPMWAGSVVQLAIFIAATGIFKGGIMTSTNSLVGLSARAGQQGVVYGIAQSAQSLGTGVGPLIGGPLASLLGFRHVFGVSAALYWVVALVAWRMLSGKATENNEASYQR
jgi:DHA1 family multidrug resistance protein-like MFS transporter